MSVIYEYLENVCEILDSYRIPITAKDRKNGKYPYYGANGLQDYVDDYIFDDELVLLAEDGGNFGSKERPIAYRVSGKCWVNNHAHVLKAKACIDINYLCYSLMFYNTDGIVNGATRKKLTQSAMRQMRIPLRNMAEQQKIVVRIDKVIQVIEKHHNEIRMLDELVQSRFVEMFGDPIENPKDWGYDVMKSVCTKITDGEHGSVKRAEKGHPFLNAKHVKPSGDIDWDTVTYTSDEVHDFIYKRCNPEGNDILMTTTGTIGNVAVVPIDREQFTMDRGITLLKLDNTKVKSSYVAWLLRHSAIQDIMKSNVHASAIGHLFLNKVEQIPVMMPDINVQEEFSSFVKQVDKSKYRKQNKYWNHANISFQPNKIIQNFIFSIY